MHTTHGLALKTFISVYTFALTGDSIYLACFKSYDDALNCRLKKYHFLSLMSLLQLVLILSLAMCVFHRK